MLRCDLVLQVGAVWLRQWCARASGPEPDQAHAHGDDAVALAVARVVLGARSGEEAASQLLDLLGDSTIEAVQDLLEVR